MSDYEVIELGDIALQSGAGLITSAGILCRSA
jgi:hypothetical protein